MAENVRKERAQSRQRRRSLAAKPFEELDQAAADDSRPTPLAAAKGVAATAAAAAVAGALAGAAKALLERDSRRSNDDAQNDETMEPQVDSAESPEPEPEQRVQEEEPSDDEPEAEPDDDEPPAISTTAEAEAEPGDDDAEAEHARGAETQADEPSDEQDQGHESNGVRGRSASDTMQIVEQAREHLKNLLGEDAESVSGIERENGNWSVTLEVVEMHRIPESTDILSSYSAVLDDDGGIVSLTRGRRYRRSQVEDS
jgi:hypothetical protein